ncbi:MAG: hypothetical protein WC831_01240 [Parcubacteria group bacterium]|jgi:hypothetical protein
MFERADKQVQDAIRMHGGHYVKMNKDGTVRLANLNPCLQVVVSAELTDLHAYAAFNPLQPCSGLEVQTTNDYMVFASPDKGGGCQPAAIGHDLPVMVADLDLRREVLYSSLVAPELKWQQMAAPTKCEAVLVPWVSRWDKAELKKIVGNDSIFAQDMAGTETSEVNAADPRALLNSLTKAKKIELAAPAQTYVPYGSRAANSFDDVIPAARGATAIIGSINLAAVPFEMRV